MYLDQKTLKKIKLLNKNMSQSVHFLAPLLIRIHNNKKKESIKRNNRTSDDSGLKKLFDTISILVKDFLTKVTPTTNYSSSQVVDTKWENAESSDRIDTFKTRKVFLSNDNIFVYFFANTNEDDILHGWRSEVALTVDKTRKFRHFVQKYGTFSNFTKVIYKKVLNVKNIDATKDSHMFKPIFSTKSTEKVVICLEPKSSKIAVCSEMTTGKEECKNMASHIEMERTSPLPKINLQEEHGDLKLQSQYSALSNFDSPLTTNTTKDMFKLISSTKSTENVIICLEPKSSKIAVCSEITTGKGECKNMASHIEMERTSPLLKINLQEAHVDLKLQSQYSALSNFDSPQYSSTVANLRNISNSKSSNSIDLPKFSENLDVKIENENPKSSNCIDLPNISENFEAQINNNTPENLNVEINNDSVERLCKSVDPQVMDNEINATKGVQELSDSVVILSHQIELDNSHSRKSKSIESSKNIDNFKLREINLEEQIADEYEKVVGDCNNVVKLTESLEQPYKIGTSKLIKEGTTTENSILDENLISKISQEEQIANVKDNSDATPKENLKTSSSEDTDDKIDLETNLMDGAEQMHSIDSKHDSPNKHEEVKENGSYSDEVLGSEKNNIKGDNDQNKSYTLRKLPVLKDLKIVIIVDNKLDVLAKSLRKDVCNEPKLKLKNERKRSAEPDLEDEVETKKIKCVDFTEDEEIKQCRVVLKPLKITEILFEQLQCYKAVLGESAASKKIKMCEVSEEKNSSKIELTTNSQGFNDEITLVKDVIIQNSSTSTKISTGPPSKKMKIGEIPEKKNLIKTESATKTQGFGNEITIVKEVVKQNCSTSAKSSAPASKKNKMCEIPDKTNLIKAELTTKTQGLGNEITIVKEVVKPNCSTSVKSSIAPPSKKIKMCDIPEKKKVINTELATNSKGFDDEITLVKEVIKKNSSTSSKSTVTQLHVVDKVTTDVSKDVSNLKRFTNIKKDIAKNTITSSGPVQIPTQASLKESSNSPPLISKNCQGKSPETKEIDLLSKSKNSTIAKTSTKDTKIHSSLTIAEQHSKLKLQDHSKITESKSCLLLKINDHNGIKKITNEGTSDIDKANGAKNPKPIINNSKLDKSPDIQKPNESESNIFKNNVIAKESLPTSFDVDPIKKTFLEKYTIPKKTENKVSTAKPPATIVQSSTTNSEKKDIIQNLNNPMKKEIIAHIPKNIELPSNKLVVTNSNKLMPSTEKIPSNIESKQLISSVNTQVNGISNEIQGSQMKGNNGEGGGNWGKPNEGYDFVSHDAAENADNFHEDWNKVRNVSNVCERYRAIRELWRNLAIPDPSRNLTFRHARGNSAPTRRHQVITNRRQRSLSCSSMYETMIENATLNAQTSFLELEETHQQDVNKISMYYRQLSYHNFSRMLLEEHDRNLQSLNLIYSEHKWTIQNNLQKEIRHYQDYIQEIRTFHSFYQGLDENDNANKMTLTPEQVDVIDDAARTYEAYNRIYGQTRR